jgi:hypothetical protein
MQDYFTANKIAPVKAPKGTYVVIKEKALNPALGKFITVKYGQRFGNNQQFDAGVCVLE